LSDSVEFSHVFSRGEELEGGCSIKYMWEKMNIFGTLVSGFFVSYS
jgi:hypothetical protein